MNKQILFDLSYQDLKKLFNNFLDCQTGNKYHNENVKWQDADGTINVIAIRCNDIYITNDMNRSNDYLCIVHNTGDSYEQFVYNCTTDPKTRRTNIANICEQSYLGNIRNHHWTPGRVAICQDNCKVWVRRYNGNTWVEQYGFFTINIHNPQGFFNSSLGCIILATDDSYISTFRPLLNKVKLVTNEIPVIVMQEKTFNNLRK
jgi:hypothetical protein